MVIGIESGYAAIEDARKNATMNGITNVEFIADDLQKGLKPLLERKLKADVIVLDPPAPAPRSRPSSACSPSSPGRSSTSRATLDPGAGPQVLHLFGFRLDRLQPVDMFPWTYHIECVAEMARRNSGDSLIKPKEACFAMAGK